MPNAVKFAVKFRRIYPWLMMHVVDNPNRRETVIRKAVPLTQLVPFEPTLSRESIERYKALIRSGEIEPPKVVPIREFYYVTDGNHRIMAAKELGKNEIVCDVVMVKRRNDVSDPEVDECEEAIRAGLAGFCGLKFVGTDAEKVAACEEDSDDGSPLRTRRRQLSGEGGNGVWGKDPPHCD